MTASRETIAHAATLFNTLYQVLGEHAPRVSDDTYVVRLYEVARSSGEVVLRMRTYLGDAEIGVHAAMNDALLGALNYDESGAMALYALVSVVGPRVLVFLRDASRQVDLDDGAETLLGEAASVLVRQMLLTGELARDRSPIDDPEWHERARELDAALERSENAESFGFSR